MEPGLLGQVGFGIGGHSEGCGFLEGVVGRVHPDVDVGGYPAVGGVDVAWTGRRHAHEVGEGTQQNVVAGPGPRFLEVELVVVIQVGVVEEVDGLPAAAGSHAVGRQDHVEVVAAVDVSRVAHVGVVLGVACRVEGVVATDGVLDDLDHGSHVHVEVLGVQAGQGVAGAHEAPGHGGVEAPLDAFPEVGGGEALEVRALPALDVDDLDELSCRHLVCLGGGPVDAEVLVLVCQRIGKDLHSDGRQCRPVDVGDHVRGRILLMGEHLVPGCTDDADDVGLGGEPRRLACRRVGGEEVDGLCPAEVDALCCERLGHPAGVMAAIGQNAGDTGCRGSGSGPQQPGVGPPRAVERGHLDRLTSLGVDDFELVAGCQQHSRDGSTVHPVALDTGAEVGQAGQEQPGHPVSGHRHAHRSCRPLAPARGVGWMGRLPVDFGIKTA